jgi:hypothetical protein
MRTTYGSGGRAARSRGGWRVVALLILWVVGAAAPVTAQAREQREGEILGRVVDGTTGWPVAGAEVGVVGTSLKVWTDSAGGFRLAAVPAGVVALEVSAPGFAATRHSDVVVSTARPVRVVVRLAVQPLELEAVAVRPSAFPSPVVAPTSTYRLQAEEVRRAPGAWEDVVRAVAVLPGIAPTAVHSNALVVRGGAPFENLFVVDGLEVGNINHFAAQGGSGGQTSMLNLALVERVDFSAGGFGVSGGDRIGSVTTIDLREGLEDGHGFDMNLALTGLGVLAEGPVGAGSYVVGVRRSYLDLLLEWSGEAFFTRYWDVNARVTQRLGARDQLTWTFVGAADEFGFNIDGPDDAYDATIMATNDDQYFTGLTWTHLRERSRFRLTAGRISHAFDIFQNDTLGLPAFTNLSDEVENSLRATLTRSFPGGSTLEAGAVAKHDARLAYEIWLPGEYRPDVDGNPMPLEVDTSFSAVRLGSYVEGVVRWGPRVSTRLGGRVDYYDHLGRAVRFAPRAALTVGLDDATSVSLSAGRYWQAPGSIWLVGDPGNPSRLKPLRADHGVLGIRRLLGSEMVLQVEGYYKLYGDYPARIWHPAAVVAPSEFDVVSADVPFGLEPLESTATGRAYGAELLLQKRLGEIPVYGLLSLAVSRSEFTGLDGEARPGRYDTPVIGNVALGWKPNSVWDVGLRFRAASGQPETPFITSGPHLGRLDLNRYNEGGRMPVFHALDLRIDRRWHFRGAQLTTYLDIQDVYDRDNPIGYYWDFREGAPRYETALGLWPSIGVNVAF